MASSDRDHPVDLALMHGVARPCPDCGDERLFVPVADDLTGDYACTWCGAALLIDPSTSHPVAAAAARVA